MNKNKNPEDKKETSRREFIATSGKISAYSALVGASPAAMSAIQNTKKKKRVALVGTGIRGITFWGKKLRQDFSDALEHVALCDINPGRLAFAKEYLDVNCPTFTDFDVMMKQVDIDMLIVTTVDSTHHEFIIKALQHNIDVVTEKPMTTDEDKCQAILDAQEKSKGKLIVAFNYRYGNLFTELKERLINKEIDKVTSIDFSWYLNVYHGASYFRRWHGLRDKSGTLLLHKSAHHFDLLNWWIGAEPTEVQAMGKLEHYGANNPFRGNNCRDCKFKTKCDYYWDINKNDMLVKLYVENEKHDGYIRDNCLWRKEIDIFDKMTVAIKYANNVQVNYSLTTYSPFEGFRLAFNGTGGRMETWEGIPWLEQQQQDQAAIYEKGMSTNSHSSKELGYHEINIMQNFGSYQGVKLPFQRKAHWGGDPIMHAQIFKGIPPEKNFGQMAGAREGAMGILIGIAARKSIDEKRPVKISELTTLQPKAEV